MEWSHQKNAIFCNCVLTPSRFLRGLFPAGLGSHWERRRYCRIRQLDCSRGSISCRARVRSDSRSAYQRGSRPLPNGVSRDRKTGHTTGPPELTYESRMGRFVAGSASADQRDFRAILGCEVHNCGTSCAADLALCLILSRQCIQPLFSSSSASWGLRVHRPWRESTTSVSGLFKKCFAIPRSEVSFHHSGPGGVRLAYIGWTWPQSSDGKSESLRRPRLTAETVAVAGPSLYSRRAPYDEGGGMPRRPLGGSRLP